MRREIKFRAWDETSQTLADVLFLSFDNKKAKIKHWEYGESIWLDFKEIELLQYTGLKDKNGVEIYDNYIVEKEYKTINGSIQKFVMRVFQDHTGSWRVKYPNGKTDTVHSIRKELTVIGNNYGNPELLEESK